MKFQVFLIFSLLLVCYNSQSIEDLDNCLKDEKCYGDSACFQNIVEKCDVESPEIKNDKYCVFFSDYVANEVKKMTEIIDNTHYYSPSQMKQIFYESYKVQGEHKIDVDIFIMNYSLAYNEYIQNQNTINEESLKKELKIFPDLLLLSRIKQVVSDDVIIASYECQKKCGTLLTNNDSIEFNKKVLQCYGTIPKKEKSSLDKNKSNSNVVLMPIFVSITLLFISLI